MQAAFCFSISSLETSMQRKQLCCWPTMDVRAQSAGVPHHGPPILEEGTEAELSDTRAQRVAEVSLSLITQGEKPPPAAPPESLQASLSPLHYRATPAIGTPSSHWAGTCLPHLYTVFGVPFLKGPQKMCFFHFYQLPFGFQRHLPGPFNPFLSHTKPH